MAKQIIGTDIGSYTFNAATKTVTLSGVSINLEQLLLITNTTKNVIIYQFNNPSLGATISGGNTLVLTYNTIAHSNSDRLQVIVDYTEAAVTMPVSVASLPLPIGASTSALQTSGNSSLSTIATNTTGLAQEAGGHLASLDTKLPSQGQALSSASLPVVLPAAQITALTPPTTVTAIQGSGSNLHVNVDNFPASQTINGTVSVNALPTGANTIGAVEITDGTNGNAAIKAASTAALSTDKALVVAISPNNVIPVSTTSLPLPTGAATSTNQTNGTQQTQVVQGGNTLIIGSAGNILVSGLTGIGIAPALNPVSISGVDGGGLKRHFLTDTSGRIEIDTAQSLPLPTNAAQETGGHLASVDTKLTTTANGLKTDGSAVTQPVSAASLPLPTGASTSANQTNGSQQTQIVQGGNTLNVGSSGNILVSGLTGVGVAPALNPISTSGVDGGGLKRHFLTDTSGRLEIDTIQSLPLPTGASSAALQITGNTSLSSIATNTGNIPVKGAATTLNSTPVNIASDQIIPVSGPNDLYVTGQSAQTTIVNNILTVTSGSPAIDLIGYHSGSVQVTSTGTAGTYIFETSNDNINFQTMTVYDQSVITGIPITAAITATATQKIYAFPVVGRYNRLRIVTTIIGGSIQAFSKFSAYAFTAAVTQVAQATTGNLNTTATIASGTVTTVSTVTANNGAAAPVTDIASAAITITTTSATVSLANIQSISFNVACTAVSGTTPTIDIVVQETIDNVNWYDIYHFERITSTGFWVSPLVRVTGQQLRYVRTVAGTTPSFTMSLIREQRQINAPIIRRIFDRSIAPNIANSTTAVMFTDSCDEIQIVQSSAAGASVAPVFTLQGSEDNANWFQLTPAAISVTGTASTTSQNYSSVGSLPKYVRAQVTTTGTGSVLNYICLKAKG